MRWILILCLLFGACKSQDKTICAQVIYIKNYVYIDGVPVTKANAPLCASQTIETKIDSAAIIQISEYAVMTLKQNTKLKLIKAKNLDPHRIYVNAHQYHGSTFSKIKADMADYFVATSTIVVSALKAKSFEVISNEAQTEVKTYQGKVLLRRPKMNIPVDDERWRVYIGGGEKSIITAKNIETPKPLTPEEKSRLKIMNQINFWQKDLTAFAFKNIAKDSLTLQTDLETKFIIPLTNQDVKNFYGTLSNIKLRNGYEYVGAFKTEGKKTLIFTASNNFYVATDLIESTLPVK